MAGSNSKGDAQAPLSRRQFLLHGGAGAGGLVLAGMALRGLEVPVEAAEAAKNANPFPYDVERISVTDPKLVRYERVAQFGCLQPNPRRLAVGPGDRLYVAGKHGVSVLDDAGGRLNEFALKEPARCIAVAADGTIFVGVRNHVEVLDAQGRPQAAWEPLPKGAWLTGLAVTTTDVFAADAGKRVVLRYDRSGKLLGRIGEKNKDRNVPGLVVPSPYLTVVVGRDGLLRLNDPGRHQVEIYTVNGDFELAWGKATAAIEGFCGCCNPVGLALLPDGRYVTCEKGLPRVKVYSAEGQFECVVAGPESFRENGRPGAARNPDDDTLGGLDAAVDAQGRIHILDLATGQIHVMQRKA